MSMPRKAAATAPAWRLLLRYATEHGVPGRSLRVALVVGIMLNLINQGDALFSGGAISWVKLLLTFFVPYCVSTYGAVAFRLGTEGGRR